MLTSPDPPLPLYVAEAFGKIDFAGLQKGRDPTTAPEGAVLRRLIGPGTRARPVEFGTADGRVTPFDRARSLEYVVTEPRGAAA